MNIREMVEQYKKREFIVEHIKSTKQVRLIGDSMLPIMHPSRITILFISNCKTYYPGDIIVFKYAKSPIGIVVHRIIEITKDHIITKGDNNTFSDDYIDTSFVIGKVEKAMLKNGQLVAIKSSKTVALLSKGESHINKLVSPRLSKTLHIFFFKLYQIFGT